MLADKRDNILAPSPTPRMLHRSLEGTEGTLSTPHRVSLGEVRLLPREGGAPAPTQALGRRLLGLAATEAEPYAPLLVTAEWVARGHGPATDSADEKDR